MLCLKLRNIRIRYIAVVAAAFALEAAGVNTATADIKPGAVKKLRSMRTCASGYSIVSVDSHTYKCVRYYTETCRKKYSPVQYNPSHGIQHQAPSASSYVCEKTGIGNANTPTAQDCTAGFTRAAEIPNSKYECRRAFKANCRIGYRFSMLEYTASATSAGNEMAIAYYCKRPANKDPVQVKEVPARVTREIGCCLMRGMKPFKITSSTPCPKTGVRVSCPK